MSKEIHRGRFVWHELTTTDPKPAEGFYTALLGWTATPFESGGQPYTMLMNGETPIAGLMALPPAARDAGAPPSWTAYVEVPDADATTARALELGAKALVAGIEIPNMGRFSVLADPQGAVIAVWTSAGEVGGHDGEPGLGEFSWNELLTSDHEAAFGFYSELFGWQKLAAMDMGPMGTYQLYGKTELPLGGMMSKTADMPGPPCWVYYIRVPDVQAAAERVKELGGQVVHGPLEVPGGDWIVQCLDPQGALFALHHKATVA